ncbi:hypothetical protein GQ55_2G113600 [Panicum hallii var. hallii]|uniref:Uncharacterized protein n=1 Tax=Panicum hallii var. hallii TaxID=1504633 RepID=A0A2T7ENU1_9POAL|nr:hypothetical protein GQ55_2G113600 [Panicum hallii var. hallii]
MQRIDVFIWLADVVNSLGGMPPQVQTMERQQFKTLTISFDIPAREDLGTMIPIIASGKESPIEMTYERSAMEVCLERHDYLIPDLSWFKIRVLQQNEHDIVSLCERLAQENQNDMLWRSWVIIGTSLRHPVLEKACIRLLLRFDLPRLLLRNQCSPSTVKHFLVDVKLRTTHLSVL